MKYTDESWDPEEVFNELREHKGRIELDPDSKQYLYQNPFDWAASRSRLLKAALLTGSRDQFRELLFEYAGAVGKERAIHVVIEIWGRLVGELLDAEEEEKEMEA